MTQLKSFPMKNGEQCQAPENNSHNIGILNADYII